MKIILRVFTLVFFFISCTKEKASHITFSGKIKNNTENILKVTNYNSTLSEEIAIDSSGNFSDPVVIQEDGYYFFQIGRSYTTVRFKKEYDVHVSIDANDFYNSMNYSGDLKIENNYNVAKSLRRANLLVILKNILLFRLISFYQKSKELKIRYLVYFLNQN